MLTLALLGLCACARPQGDPPAAEPGTTAAELDYAHLTGSWSEAALRECGPAFMEALGTRDLLQYALQDAAEPNGAEASDLGDARSWLAAGDERLAVIHAQLEAGVCDETVKVSLDEAVRSYIRAGTVAVRAGQGAGR